MGTLRDLQFALQLKIEELRQRDTLIDELELELDTKDELIRRLQEELDRYRATTSLSGPPAANPAPPAQIEDTRQSKRQTVISEPFTPDPVTLTRISHKSCDKSQDRFRRWIQAAFLKNDFLKNLEEEEVKAIASCMHRCTINQGSAVIQEGSVGDQAFVLEEGRLAVTKDAQNLLTIEPETAFGELALLYSWNHDCSVTALEDSRLWVIDRKSYQTVLMHCTQSRLFMSMELLRSLPFLQSLPEDVIMKISELMKEMNYADGEYIIQQGAAGDNLYIISKGKVTMTERKMGHEEQLVVSELSEKQWFGEKALWREDIWTESAIAVGEVSCLVLDRKTFKDNIDEMTTNFHQDIKQSNDTTVEMDEDPSLLTSSTLSDFQIIRSLAVGEFGHVDLVQLKSNVKFVFAMKVLKRKQILDVGQQEQILRAGRILLEARSPFIVRQYRVFRNPEHLYVLNEACLGGNLSSLITERGSLDNSTTRFYTACVVEALAFLHQQGVVYRDIKPEHVALDEHGYAKLMGSRCMKKLEEGKKTWTFCGRLGCMAPEVILSKGHGVHADLWSLGVFVFELLSGRLPFGDSDQMRIVTATINGISQIEFPKTINKEASDLIRKLCRSNPSERLCSQRNGVKDIQKHKWFEKFSWHGLHTRSLDAPVIPDIQYSCGGMQPCGAYSKDSVDLCTDWDDF